MRSYVQIAVSAISFNSSKHFAVNFLLLNTAMKHHQIIRAHACNFLADSPYYASSTVHICHHQLSRLSIFTCPFPKKCFLYVQENIYTSCSVSGSISYTVIHKHGLAINKNCAVSVTSFITFIHLSASTLLSAI
jgi:hypothetical protein